MFKIGYRLSSSNGCLAMIKESDGIGADTFHSLPDSKHKDHHEKIAEGNIAIEAIATISNYPSLPKPPSYLKTPNDAADCKQESGLLKSRYAEVE